jgi:ech hydrogenase subunit A
MQLQVALIAVLVLAPLACGGLMLTGLRGKARDILVAVAALVTMAAGIAFPLASDITRVAFPPVITRIAAILEPLLVLAVLAIGFRIRSWPIRLMAIAQLGLCLTGFVGPHEEGAPDTILVVDALSTILVLIVSVIGGLIALYAVGYMHKHEHHAPATAAGTNRFFCILIAFLGLMNGLVLVDTLKWLSIFWEGTTLCSFLLIGHDGTAEARASARRAITLNVFGGLALSLGGFLALRETGTESLAQLMSAGALLPLAFLIVATMTKSALMPFQGWLLGAMVAPTPVSALLHSSTMVKAGSYLILRLAPAMADSHLGTIVAVAGGFTFAVTSALAIGQSNGKKVLAYSTIANLGLISALAGIHTPLAFAAALTLLVYHAISKALLFLCVGTIEQTIGSRHIEDMGGLLFKMPLTTTVAIVGMISMMMPPFGMLIGKWMAIESAVHNPLLLILFVIGSALTIFFWAKWLGRITTASYHPAYAIETISPWMRVVLAGMAIGVLVASLAALPIYEVAIKPISMSTFGHGAEGGALTLLDSVDAFLGWPLVVVLGALFMAALTGAALFKRSHVRQPYLCGENIPDAPYSFQFRGLADSADMALVNSYYLSPLFGESAITAWGNPLAALLILTLFGVLFL